MNHADEVHLEKLTRREFRERMQNGQLRACIIPVGAIEQHREHLALANDWQSVSYVAEAVSRRLEPHVLVVSAVMAGISEHHMSHPGTVSLRPATFLAVVNDAVGSAVRAGFQNILVLNGHGGNVEPCKGVWSQWLRLFQVNLHFLSYWDVLTEEDARELLTGGHRMPEDLPGHAEEFETSIALAAFPQSVRRDVLAEHGDDTGLLIDIANLAIDDGDYARAGDFYVMVVDLNETDTDATNDADNKSMLVAAGTWYAGSNVGRYEDAIAVLDRAADLETIPTSNTLLMRQRTYYQYAKDIKKQAETETDPALKTELADKSTTLFNRAMEIGVAMTNNFPATAEGFLYLSLTQFELGDFAGAEANNKTFEELQSAPQ